MIKEQFDIVLEAQGWNGVQWIQIKQVDDMLEVYSSLEDQFDMPHTEPIEDWGKALPIRIGQIIGQFLHDSQN